MSGIIHVGAHRGEEVQSYLDAGHERIVLFEPIPWLANELMERWRDKPVVTYAAALGSYNGKRWLWIPERLAGDGDDSASASFYRADRRSGFDWGERDRKGRSIEVKVFRFDTFAWPKWMFEKAVIDVQGDEFNVLLGFGARISELREIVVECSLPAIYEDGADARSVNDYLLACGFTRTTPLVEHGDVCFVKR